MPLPDGSGPDLSGSGVERQIEHCFHAMTLRFFTTESSILAQNERWRRGLGMQVERECDLRIASTVANG